MSWWLTEADGLDIVVVNMHRQLDHRSKKCCHRLVIRTYNLCMAESLFYRSFASIILRMTWLWQKFSQTWSLSELRLEFSRMACVWLKNRIFASNFLLMTWLWHNHPFGLGRIVWSPPPPAVASYNKTSWYRPCTPTLSSNANLANIRRR